jgi:hypothetical protein
MARKTSWKVGEIRQKLVRGRIVRIKRIRATGFPQYRILTNRKRRR